MADVGFRDLIGSFAPGRRTEPTVAPPAQAAPPVEQASQRALVTPPPPAAPPLFGPHRQPADELGLDPTFTRLAELALHRRTGTPLVIGIGGAPGSGKSFALRRIVAQAQALAGGAADAAETPFVSRIHVADIDAAALDGEPMLALAARLHASLRDSFPDLAREIGHLARDPHAAFRDCSDKLDDARRRLDGERRALDDAGSRRARLIETVLYETSGSAVDAYARANRAGLERRFAGFGIGGDALRSYKDHVLNAARSGGLLSLALRSFWAFKGQFKLIVAAALLVAVGIGLGIAIETHDGWLAAVRSGPQAGASAANWLQDHIGLLSTARTTAFTLAVLCILANLWRAFAFLRPIARGSALLGGDLDGRRRDLDGLYAHQTKRVDALEADVDRLTREAGAAERRVGDRPEPSPFEAASAGSAAALFAAVSSATRPGKGRDAGAPERVLLVLDQLDSVAPERAHALVSALRRGLGEGLVALVAFDPLRVGDAARGELHRCVDIPVILPPLDAPGSLVTSMLGRSATPSVQPRLAATSSNLDGPLGDGEAELLAAVAPLAGSTPRATRRFVDLYRLARLEGDAQRGALALTLASRLGGTDGENGPIDRASATNPGAGEPHDTRDGPLRRARDAAARFDGGAPGADALAAASAQAKRYGFDG